MGEGGERGKVGTKGWVSLMAKMGGDGGIVGRGLEGRVGTGEDNDV